MLRGHYSKETPVGWWGEGAGWGVGWGVNKQVISVMNGRVPL